MSIDKSYYVIGGYDLTDFKTEKYDDWRWTEQGEEYTCSQINGEIQLFDDPMNGSHLYFGYIFASGDEYDGISTTCFATLDVENCRANVEEKLFDLHKAGVINDKALACAKFKIIVFDEYT